MPVDNSFFTRLRDSESLTDVLIQMEDFLDGLDLYVFKNWIEGEVVEGPEITRYWTKMVLKYDYEMMPDPTGGLRLIDKGAKVMFRKDQEERPRDIKDPSDYREDRHGKPALDMVDIWLVEIHIPRRFIEELDDDDLELAANNADISLDQVSDARDEDIDSQSALDADEAEASAEGEPKDNVEGALDKLG